MGKTHILTPEEKLELEAIIAMGEGVRSLYDLAADIARQAVAAAEKRDLVEARRLHIQSLECELRALDAKSEMLDRHQKFLQDIARAEGWIVSEEALNARTGEGKHQG